jgi:hypothetical protein
MSKPNDAYGQVASEALPMIASLFMSHFGNTSDPRAQQFAQMHQYSAQNHPGILGEVVQNPQVSSALGGLAENEMRNIFGGRGL